MSSCPLVGVWPMSVWVSGHTHSSPHVPIQISDAISGLRIPSILGSSAYAAIRVWPGTVSPLTSMAYIYCTNGHVPRIVKATATWQYYGMLEGKWSYAYNLFKVEFSRTIYRILDISRGKKDSALMAIVRWVTFLKDRKRLATMA